MLKIPKLVLPLDLSGYSPDLKGETLQVWVDPPRKLRQEYDGLLVQVQQEEIQRVSVDLKPDPASGGVAPVDGKLHGLLRKAQTLLNARRAVVERREGTDTRILKWYAVIWSQGDMPMTLDELQRIEDENPAFLGWLIQETWRMIHENQVRLKKN